MRKEIKCAIATCGGLCPGLNNVIQSIVMKLEDYGVSEIYGIRHGLQGFIPSYGHTAVKLTAEVVAGIHEKGGTILGTSRGAQDSSEIVNYLEEHGINTLFMIGGDGTIRATQKIIKEVERRELSICVISVPKTIDNDIYMIDRSFGFRTAVETASNIVKAAHSNSEAHVNNISIVRVFGRNHGFIAAEVGKECSDIVDFTLIPEVNTDLDTLLQDIEQKLEDNKHVVILVAEGACQYFFQEKSGKKDPSGNIMNQDIGAFLKRTLTRYLNCKKTQHFITYFDPGHLLTSTPANALDAEYCSFLGTHAAIAGINRETGIIVNQEYYKCSYVPIAMSVGRKKRMGGCE